MTLQQKTKPGNWILGVVCGNQGPLVARPSGLEQEVQFGKFLSIFFGIRFTVMGGMTNCYFAWEFRHVLPIHGDDAVMALALCKKR